MKIQQNKVVFDLWKHFKRTIKKNFPTAKLNQRGTCQETLAQKTFLCVDEKYTVNKFFFYFLKQNRSNPLMHRSHYSGQLLKSTSLFNEVVSLVENQSLVCSLLPQSIEFNSVVSRCNCSEIYLKSKMANNDDCWHILSNFLC